MGETLTETFQLGIEGGSWQSSLISPTVTIPPCQTGQVMVRVTVPDDLPISTPHIFTITASLPDVEEPVARIPINHRTPGHFLLVNDHRFYDRTPLYQEALDGLGLNYDILDISKDDNYPFRVTPELLAEYDMVWWYTGYDWFQPVSDVELPALESYVANGGRLFLSSQDFLYYHQDKSFTNVYLGIADYAESVSPTLVYADSSLPFSIDYPLSFFPYQNSGDGILPAPNSANRTTQADFWHNGGMVGGVASYGANWRTLFWGMPWETLPANARHESTDHIVGWLSDLGTRLLQWINLPRYCQPSHLYYQLASGGYWGKLWGEIDKSIAGRASDRPCNINRGGNLRCQQAGSFMARANAGRWATYNQLPS